MKNLLIIFFIASFGAAAQTITKEEWIKMVNESAANTTPDSSAKTTAKKQTSTPDTATHVFQINYGPKKLNYPQAALENHIQGTVMLVMDIDSTCSIINRKVLSGLGYGCDEEALKSLVQFQNDLKKEHKSKCPPIKDFKFPIKFKMD